MIRLILGGIRLVVNREPTSTNYALPTARHSFHTPRGRAFGQGACKAWVMSKQSKTSVLYRRGLCPCLLALLLALIAAALSGSAPSYVQCRAACLENHSPRPQRTDWLQHCQSLAHLPRNQSDWRRQRKITYSAFTASHLITFGSMLDDDADSRRYSRNNLIISTRRLVGATSSGRPKRESFRWSRSKDVILGLISRAIH